MIGWRKRRAAPRSDSPDSATSELRREVLELDPAAVGLAPTAERPRVWAGLMDMGYPDKQWACLVAVGDGTVSLSTSKGGGVIGAGGHPTVESAAQQWLAMLEAGLDVLLPLTDPPGLPDDQHVTIRALTFDGQRAVTAVRDDLGYERHPASGLFHAAHEVITQMRLRRLV